MSLRVIQNATAIAPGLTTSFGAAGGTAPYVFSVMSGGAGGIINASTGIYTAPPSMSENSVQISDYIQVIDSLGAVAASSILVGNALLLFCDIIQNQMGLDPGRVYLWNQKIMQPIDDGLYVAVSIPTCKPFANNISFDGSGTGLGAVQVVNMLATVDIDIISRGPAARDQKELVLMALTSVYSEQQQEANSFQISRLTTGFINLSEIDGAAIPYRFKLTCKLNYGVSKSLQVPYFDTFQIPSVVTDA